jgi:hypothetical protein
LAVGAALALALPTGAAADPPGAAEQPYAFEARAAGFDRSLDPDLGSPLAARDRAVEIRWVARELPTLAAYRLTVAVDGSDLPLARWTIVPGTGRAIDTDGLRAYRMGLPLRAQPGLAVHASLEAVRSDGRLELLARLDDMPWERRGADCNASPASPRLDSGAAEEGVGLVRSAACLPASAPAASLIPVAGPDAERPAAGSRAPCLDLRERGPPPRADL